MINMKTIGEKISIARENEDLTRSELAAILNIAPQKIIDWEKDLDIPNAAMIKRLSEILNVHVDYFFEDTKFLESNIKDIKAADENNLNGISNYFKHRDMYSYGDYDEDDKKINIRVALISFTVCIINFLIALVIILVVNRTAESLLLAFLGGLLPIAATQFNLWYLRNPDCSECSCYRREYEEVRAVIGVVIFIIISLVLPWIGVGIAFSG